MKCFEQDEDEVVDYSNPFVIRAAVLQDTKIESSNYFRYELASIARLESVLLGVDRDLPLSPEKRRWITCLREMFVHFENIGK